MLVRCSVVGAGEHSLRPPIVIMNMVKISSNFASLHGQCRKPAAGLCVVIRLLNVE